MKYIKINNTIHSIKFLKRVFKQENALMFVFDKNGEKEIYESILDKDNHVFHEFYVFLRFEQQFFLDLDMTIDGIKKGFSELYDRS